MANVMLCDGRGESAEVRDLAALLRANGHEVDPRLDPNGVIEAVMQRRPDILIYPLRADSESDLILLRVARRAIPEALLIVIASEGSIATRTAVQPLKPTWYSVAPADPAELSDVIRVASRRRVHGVRPRI